jgi:hypothetical protein
MRRGEFSCQIVPGDTKRVSHIALPHHVLRFGSVKVNHNPTFGPVVVITTLGDKDMTGLIYSISPWTFVYGIPQAVFPPVHLTFPN